MKIYEYDSYEDYVKAQNYSNGVKLDWVYVQEATIQRIVQRKPDAGGVICHGTRNGAEQQLFKQLLPHADVIGTEISDTAKQFPMTVQHDFTLPNDDWLGKFDIVYSNSFDHSIDPAQTLVTWKGQLTNDGCIFLEYSERQSVCKRSDPLMATNKEVRELIKQATLTLVDEFTSGKNGGLVFVLNKN